MGAGVFGAVGLPTLLLSQFALGVTDLDFGFVGEIPTTRVFALFGLTDCFVLVRHLQLLFPVQGSCKGVGDRRRVELEATRDEVIGAWFVIRGV